MPTPPTGLPSGFDDHSGDRAFVGDLEVDAGPALALAEHEVETLCRTPAFV